MHRQGKARQPYEFGCKVGIAATNREGLVLAAKAFEDNPYDGHTLSGTVDRALAMGGVDPDRIYVDKGYRGHDYTGPAAVLIAGSRRGLTPTMRRELKRRSAIEPTIGHMKTDVRLDRNFLLGHVGDTINALLVAAGHNLRLILATLALWRTITLTMVITMTAKPDTSPNFPATEYQCLSKYSGPTR